MKNILLLTFAILIASCSNPEADLEAQIQTAINAKNFEETISLSNQLLEINPNNLTATNSIELANRELEISKLSESLKYQTANKDYFKIIKTSKELLDLDSDNIQAINAFREAARMYEILKEAADLMLILETSLDQNEYNGDIDFSVESEFNKYAQRYYNIFFLDDDKTPIDEDGKMGPSTKEAIKVLNYMVGGSKKEEATDVPNEELAGCFESIELYYQLESNADSLKESVSILEDIKKLFDKAERLDPRFAGVIELEKFLEKRANFLTFKIVYGWYDSFSYEIANSHLGVFDSFYSLTNTYWDNYSQLNSYSSYSSTSYSTSDAYASAREAIERIFGHHNLEIVNPTFISINNKYKNMLKDIDDEFDIDVIKPTIDLSNYIVRITELAYNAEGSLDGWYDSMLSVVEEYRDSYSEIQDEYEVDKIIDSVEEDSESIREYYLDQEVLDSYNAVKSISV
jgi:tetratricopeptide (TPR) repeat protein